MFCETYCSDSEISWTGFASSDQVSIRKDGRWVHTASASDGSYLVTRSAQSSFQVRLAGKTTDYSCNEENGGSTTVCATCGGITEWENRIGRKLTAVRRFSSSAKLTYLKTETKEIRQ